MEAAVWVIVALVVGFVGFFALALALVFHIGRLVLSAIFGKDKPRAARISRTGQVCPHNGCGHHNAKGGVYCSRCGRSLEARREIDAYG